MSDEAPQSKAPIVAEDNNDSAPPAAARLGLMEDRLSRESPIMMQSLDPKGIILDVNHYWLERMGYPAEQVIGRHIREFLTPECARRAAAEYSSLFARPRFAKIPRELVTASGQVLEVEVDARTLRDEAGNPIQNFAIVIDVTDRNQRERALRAREEELRNLIDHSPEGIMIHAGGVYVYANLKACELLGAKDPSELIGRDALDVIHPSIREEVARRIKSIEVQSRTTELAETIFVRLDGESVYVESRGGPVIYEGKNSIQVVFHDISERKRAEEIARENVVQSEVIRLQREMLLAISTPLIPLRDGIVLMPLVGAMDDARGARAREILLDGISKHSATIAIVDVTGVPEIGAAMVEGLRQTMHAVKLLGAEVVLTGIQPAMARTMIELGMDMSGIVTRATLRDGIDDAFRRARGERTGGRR